MTVGACDGDGPAEDLYEFPGDGQTEPGPLMLAGFGRLDLGEGGKEILQIFRVNTDPAVFDRQDHAAVGRGATKLDRPGFGELGGIAAEIKEDLTDLDKVGDKDRRFGDHPDRHRSAAKENFGHVGNFL